MIEEIRKAVHDAARRDQKIAMFHFQVLKNAAAKVSGGSYGNIFPTHQRTRAKDLVVR